MPLQPADFRAALDSLAWQFGHAPGKSPIVAVVGVMPGSGVTTVAVNLAHEIAERGRDCVLVEMTTRLGKLAAQLGVTPRFTTRDLANAGKRLDAHMIEQALIPVAEHLRLLAAPHDEVRLMDPGVEAVRKFFVFLRQLAGVGVLEMSYNITESYYEGLAAVDQVLLLARQTPTALRDLKLVCQSLRQDHGVRAVYPVINRFDRRNQDLSVEQVQEALGEPMLFTIAMDRALAPRSTTDLDRLEQQTFSGDARQDIQAIARLVLGETKAPRSRENGLFGWLKSMFAGGSAR
jgi:Flp pilus assembly CpaE family ATPase